MSDALFRLLAEGVAPAERPAFVETVPLTAETIRAAMEKVSLATYTICVGGDQHCVHPAEWERGGWARCANCFQMVDLGDRP